MRSFYPLLIVLAVIVSALILMALKLSSVAVVLLTTTLLYHGAVFIWSMRDSKQPKHYSSLFRLLIGMVLCTATIIFILPFSKGFNWLGVFKYIEVKND